MKLNIFIITILLTISNSLWAHGEDKFGPNGGYLKMPGTFHTELVPNKDGSFKVFLTDLQFKNPTTKDSTVDMKLVEQNNSSSFTCKSETNYFTCSLNKKELKGKITISAKRLGVVANIATYELPLRLKGQSEPADPHAGHKM